MAYDPVKAHEYYIRTRKLKGRKNGSGSSLIGDGGRRPASAGSKRPPNSQLSSEVRQAQRVKRLQSKVDTLESALTKAQVALVKARIEEKRTERKNSDGKSTASEKQASKEYRDKNSAEIASKRKSTSSSSGGSSSSSSSSKSVDDMSVEDLETRIIKLRSALSEAKRLLADAGNSLGHMAHSAILSNPEVNVHFARYRSAERKPSK